VIADPEGGYITSNVTVGLRPLIAGPPRRFGIEVIGRRPRRVIGGGRNRPQLL